MRDSAPALNTENQDHEIRTLFKSLFDAPWPRAGKSYISYQETKYKIEQDSWEMQEYCDTITHQAGSSKSQRYNRRVKHTEVINI